MKSQLELLKEECTELEANYTKVNFNGSIKSKELGEEKDLLAPEELKLQKVVASKQNQVSSKTLQIILCFYNLKI